MSEASNQEGLPFPPLPKVGQVADRFLIERELPRGGQARVYRAWQTDLSRPVALKLLPTTFASDHETQTRFRREMENIARISHPNIVRVFEAGVVEGHPFFTMEYIEGEDLETVLQRGPLPVDEAAGIIEAAARGIAAAHAQGIIHRDIKPGNVILRLDGTPVLTDFGLAQDLAHSDQLTRTGVSMGTPAYMAPEQAKGERHRVGKLSDVYALGATLYTLLTDRRPAEGATAYEVMLKVAESQGPKWSRDDREAIPPDLRAVAEMAMQNNPARRYASALDLADDLARYLAGEWVSARSRGWVSRLWFRSRRYASVAAVLLAAGGLGAGLIVSSLRPEMTDNSPPLIYDHRDVLGSPNGDPAAEAVGEGGAWAIEGALAQRSGDSGLLLNRQGDGPIRMTCRDPLCWGDFDLDVEFRLNGEPCSAAFLLGLRTPEQTGDDPAAWAIRAAGQSPRRLEVERLGVAVQALENASPLLVPGRWYRAHCERRGEKLSFRLVDTASPASYVEIVYQDDYPALAGGRNLFGLSVDCDELQLRGVTASHRDYDRSAEELFYSIGQYEEAALRLEARLEAPLAEDETRDGRAARHFLHARCMKALGRTAEAQSALAQAVSLAQEPELKARIFLCSARIEQEEGNDAFAIARLHAARQVAFGRADTASRIYHTALEAARALQEGGQPDRALAFYDFVADNSFSDPCLTGAALIEGGSIRLEASESASEKSEALAALALVRADSYLQWPALYAKAARLHFDALWGDVVSGIELPVSQTDEMLLSCGAMFSSQGARGVRRDTMRPSLFRAAWLAHCLGRHDLAQDWRLQALASASGEERLWWVALSRLFDESRLSPTPERRAEGWVVLRSDLEAENRGHDALLHLCDYFEGSLSGERSFHAAMARALEDAPSWALGDISPEVFIEYVLAVAGIAADREVAAQRLARVAKLPNAGALRLLGSRERILDWLPPAPDHHG